MELALVQELTQGLSISQRIRALLKGGALSEIEIRKELADANTESLNCDAGYVEDLIMFLQDYLDRARHAQSS